ncbi:L-asparaginase [Bathymodiolus heckerae thiotrophic gill symbiont]|uniref:asparaginase domain-containing protein n=1 Tax=Bathymodiolus heckerae thiotrophic gill symbiont TaxID=1052212 RepID=UPI0010B49FA5|nr:asparaginase domain-containing protein [Bathymodiolus heckerae thiotrophic gill symbiont]CAC9535393.1 L-asparaginase (EC 3.5.1.1) [uncultured Gammaproteobacteria bacterium]CAC9953333.1 L-asparaginase (EC 3.5.1.1) [uncultured Gammaproteobacteria bacterium]SHN92826.1 L-asparaginase [Bathymodiolus heckerae thiotrophic gill symbiont]
MKIKVLITGGTIDKTYKKLTGKLSFTETHMVDMLNCGRSMADTLSEVLFLKDSLEMSDSDRDFILDKCQSCDEQHILITHGTDTMVETANHLAKMLKDKTVVLFGSMIPYSINQSDALFNLGVALSAVQLKDPGVYIAMNGKVFDFDKVKKDKSLGVFTKILI